MSSIIKYFLEHVFLVYKFCNSFANVNSTTWNIRFWDMLCRKKPLVTTEATGKYHAKTTLEVKTEASRLNFIYSRPSLMHPE